MDHKKHAARAAYTLIQNNSVVGLGDGSTILLLADFLKEGIAGGLNCGLYTSSSKTQKFLEEAGITVLNISERDVLDQYFDGCDQMDQQLNALKSGSGIHTSEKLLAAMAKKFILLGDESKSVSRLDPKFPLVLEILPQAIHFVLKEIKKIFGQVSLSLRKMDDSKNPVITRNGNYLIDCWFREWPEPEFVQIQSKNIVGVIEISLFYKMASAAIISGSDGIKWYERINDRIQISEMLNKGTRDGGIS